MPTGKRTEYMTKTKPLDRLLDKGIKAGVRSPKRVETGRPMPAAEISNASSRAGTRSRK